MAKLKGKEIEGTMAKRYIGYYSDFAIPPGETIKESLEFFGMTQVEFAKRMNLAPKTVNEIITGKAPITAPTAIGLEYVLGPPASFWLELEKNYQVTKARIDAKKNLKQKSELLRRYPTPL